MDHVPARPPSSAPQVHPVRVLSVPVAPPIHVKFLGPLRGLLTHWCKSRSVPCDGASDCPITLHRSGTIFKAYAAVEYWIAHAGRWRGAVLEATANLEEYLRGRELRGQIWLLSREDEKEKSSPVVGAYCETVGEDLVSPVFPIEPVLFRFYNRTALVLDVVNPMPRQLAMSETTAPPPTTPADLQPTPPPVEDPAQRKKLREVLDAGRGAFGVPRSTGGSAARNGQQTSPAPAAGNGATGNGHF